MRERRAPRWTQSVLDSLTTHGLLVASDDKRDRTTYVPARDVSTIKMTDILAALRHERPGRPGVPTSTEDEVVAELLGELHDAARQSSRDCSLGQLALGLGSAAPGQPDE